MAEQPEGAGGGARTWREADGTHIDVRGLGPPQPMVQILRLLASLPRDAVLIAHLDRDPMMLYGELAQIGWAGERIDGGGDAGEVRLRLTAA